MLAPIVLFVYNRPWHTLQTLEALELNIESTMSVLYIYADGPKTTASAEDLENINNTRKILRQKQWCKEVIIIESDRNKGLADSIIEGVTITVNKYGKVIVLEDDIVTSTGFLKYMNEALSMYHTEEKVMHVSGYMFPVKSKLPSTFFYNTASCWGWGTWDRAWIHLNSDANELLALIDKNNQKNKFNVEESYDFYSQLMANAEGRLRTWAVKWYASFFLMDGLSLHPYPSLVNNIGHDGLGENCGKLSMFNWDKLATSIEIKKIELEESAKARNLVAEYFRKEFHAPAPSFIKSVKQVLKSKISFLTPEIIKHKVRLKRNQEYRKAFNIKRQLKSLANIPRFTEGITNVFDQRISYVDSASFIFIFEEVFYKEIYKFNFSGKSPFIIDCGANIGLSVIYFKKLYPDSEIIAFEPDSKIFDVLQFNIDSLQLLDVTLIKKACWYEETTLRFYSEGADGGRVAFEKQKQNIIEVQSVRLRNYLDRKVDFLKIDIEGAETKVIEDISDLLVNVDKLFVEYHSFAGQKQSLGELLQMLTGVGFRYYIQDVGVFSSTPFTAITVDNNMDLQLNIFAYR